MDANLTEELVLGLRRQCRCGHHTETRASTVDQRVLWFHIEPGPCVCPLGCTGVGHGPGHGSLVPLGIGPPSPDRPSYLYAEADKR